MSVCAEILARAVAAQKRTFTPKFIVKIPYMAYITFMGPEIVFIPSAFKHGFSEADIRWAMKTLIYEFLVNEYEDTYAIIGFDTKGNPLEIMYNFIDNQTMEVFHAMRCRESFLRKYVINGEEHAAYDR